jgi:hypothetical protein
MQLTDTQLVVLSAALGREDGSILPLSANLKGGAVAKVCSALLAKGLAEEIALPREAARTAPEKVFRTAEDEGPIMLRIAPLARQALNADAADAIAPAEPAPAPEPPAPKKKAARRAEKPDGGAPQAAAPASREEEAEGAEGGEDDDKGSEAKQPRAGTKLDQFIELLRRPEGVSIKEASKALDWMEHSVRGAVAGALKKKYGLTIASEKIEGRGTVYRVAG